MDLLRTLTYAGSVPSTTTPLHNLFTITRAINIFVDPTVLVESGAKYVLATRFFFIMNKYISGCHICYDFSSNVYEESEGRYCIGSHSIGMDGTGEY